VEVSLITATERRPSAAAQALIDLVLAQVRRGET